MDWSVLTWNPANFPKPVFIFRDSCRNTPQLIYINVSGNKKKGNEFNRNFGTKIARIT